MKTQLRIVRNLLLFFTLIAIVILSSCTAYYVDNAQPIDADNTYNLPKRITGSWYIKESPEDGPSNWDSISITKEYYHYIVRDEYEGAMSEIEEDSSAFIVDDKIYIKDDGKLTAVFPFTIQDDSVKVILVDHELVDFGPKAFFREIDYGYILNTKHEELWDWWDLKFIDLRNNSQMIVRGLADKDLKILPPYETLHEDYTNYLRAKWTSAEVLDFINKGGFSDTLLTLRYDERLEK